MAGKLAKDRAKRKAQTQAKERASQPSPTTVQQGGRFRSAGPANRKPKSAPQQNFEDIAAPSTGFRDAENRAKENARRQQATLAVGRGGGINRPAPQKEPILVPSSSNPKETDRVLRRTKQIEDYIEEKKQENIDAIENIKRIEATRDANLAKWQNARKSRAQDRRGFDLKPYNDAIEAEKQKSQRNESAIVFFENEKVRLKKNIAVSNSGSFATADDSASPAIRVPPAPATASVTGAVVARQNIGTIKEFLGIEKTQNKTDTKQFMPVQVEKGTLRFDNSRFGYDQNYYSTSQNKPQGTIKTALPSGEIIETESTQGKSKENRGIAGASAVVENFYTIGKDSIEAVASDAEKGKIGTGQPSELKKDIILTPMEIITKEIPPSTAKVSKGDLTGISDYISKTGKGLGEFAKDVVDDPQYYTANIGANILLGVGTLGAGQIAGSARAGLRTAYQNKVVQPKAKAIVDFVHPAKETVVTEFKPTGRTQTTKSGVEIAEQKPASTKKPETEIVTEVKPKKTNDPDFINDRFTYPTEPTGKTRKQQVSPIETFEKVADTYGYPTFRGTFKKGASGPYSSVEVVMTPKPVLRYLGKPPNTKAPATPKPQRAVQLDRETGIKIQEEIAKNPSQSKEIFNQYAIKGVGGKLVEKMPEQNTGRLATLEERNFKTGEPLAFAPGEIGKTRKASSAEIEALGARGKEVATIDTFYFDRLAERIASNPQYGNLLQSGKIKTRPASREILSVDSEYFNANYFTGETSLATAYDVKTRLPSQFKKLTPYEKEFFFEGGAEYVKPGKKMKPFESEPTKKAPSENDAPLELLSKTKQDELLSDLKGAGDFTKSPAKAPAYQTGFAYSEFEQQQNSALEPESFNRPELLSTKFNADESLNVDVFSGFEENTKQNEMTKGVPVFASRNTLALDLSVNVKPLQEVVPANVLDVFSVQDTKTSPVQDTDTMPVIAQTPETVFETPVEYGYADPIPDDPFTPTTRHGGGGIPILNLPDLAFEELLYGTKKSRGKKRFWNVDPTKALGFFDGGSLGYQDREFKEMKGKKKRQADDMNYENIGF